MAEELTEDEQRVFVDQFEEAHRRSQTEYDSSVRTIAAVGVTASLVAALDEAGWSGTLAVALSLGSLVANLASYCCRRKRFLHVAARALVTRVVASDSTLTESFGGREVSRARHGAAVDFEDPGRTLLELERPALR